MKNILQLNARDHLTAAEMIRLRKDGFVPGVIYGSGLNADGSGIMFSVSYIDLEKVMREGCFFNTVIEVELEGKKYSVLPRAAQTHVVSDRVVHVEFQQVAKDDQVEVSIPFFLVGTEKSEVVKRGGTIRRVYKGLKVRCKAGVIPKAVKLDVSELQIGGVIKVNSLKVPEGIKVLQAADLTLIKMTGKKEKGAKSDEDGASTETAA